MFSDSEPKPRPPVPQRVVICDPQGMLVSGAPSAAVAEPKPIDDHCASAATDDHCTSDHIGSHGYSYIAQDLHQR